MKNNLIGSDLILVKTDKKGNITTGISSFENIAYNFTLYQNYPNPFNPSTKIKFRLLKKRFIILKVLDVRGRTVLILERKSMDLGFHEYYFNAKNLPSGIYFYQLEVIDFSKKNEKFSIAKKMLFLK